MNLQHIIDSIRLRYNIKREYFTVGIPVVLAFLLLIGAYMTGHTLTIINPPVSQSLSDASDRLQAYAQIVKQQQALGDPNFAGVTVPATTKARPEAPVYDLDTYMIFAALVAMTPYAIDRFFKRIEKKRNEEDFTQFLFKMSELMRAGIDPIKSVIELSRSELGSLDKHIALAASAMVIGNSFEEGMRRVSKSLESELINRYIDLIVQASNMGGAVHNLILKASEDMRAMIMIQREMEGNLKQYVFIFYLGQMILIVTAYVLASQLFSALISGTSGNLFGDMGSLNFQQGFFHMLIINAMIGGIIIGKITEGSAKDGLKHSVVLTIVSYIACVMLILPSGAAVHDSIIAVSGGNQVGLVKTPLNESITFHLENAGGNPKTETTIQFNIDPSGKLSPNSAKTDDHGDVSVSVTLGKQMGLYKISAEEDNNTVASVYVWAEVEQQPSSED